MRWKPLDKMRRANLLGIPMLYAQRGKPYHDIRLFFAMRQGMHYWYVAEYDCKDVMFGAKVGLGNFRDIDWDYFSYSKIASQHMNCGYPVEFDTEHVPATVEMIGAIRGSEGFNYSR